MRDAAELRAAAEANGGSFTEVPGVDVTDDGLKAALGKHVSGELDFVINNAGYFKKERESIVAGTMDFADEVRTIDICAVGMLRVTDALFHLGCLKRGSHVVFITSQGGSIGWRDVQCPEGGDYGHHMSKAAANMAGKLVANELRGVGVSVSIFHPGFMRTEMTAKYSDAWDKEGAVSAEQGAQRVLHEATRGNLANTGRFVNCEDGKPIPW